MKGLIVSDFLLMRRVAGIYILITAVFAGIAAFGGVNNIFFVVFFSYFASAVMLSVMDLDERAGWPRYAVAGFASRRQYVLGKFCSAWILQGGAAAVFLALRLVRDLTSHISLQSDFETVFFMLAMMVAANAVMMLFQFPVTFKFGSARGRLISIAVVVVIAVGTGVFSAIAGSGASSSDAQLSGWVAALPSLSVLSVLLLAAAAVLYAAAVGLSLKLFAGKEL